MLRKNYVLGFCMAGLAILLASCGGSKSSTPPPTVTGLKKRVLLSNSQTGVVTIMDAQKDVFVRSFGATAPTKIVTASGTTAILESAVNQILFFKNATEVATTSGALLGVPVDIAISSDGLT